MCKRRKYENWILPLFVMGISAFLMGILFDFYYDLNDDTMMRDIMSGVYSGIPDGHNMQTLYPLGAVIALCYRINGSLPWYGVFLFLCQFGCFLAVGVRLCALTDVSGTRRQMRAETGSDACAGNDVRDSGGKRRLVWKLLGLAVLVLFQWGIWLTHMINVQYTITCGMLVGTAVFLFVTIPPAAVQNVSEGGTEAQSVRDFLMKSLPSLLLFLLAFQLRSEMALLLLPFLGLAGAFRWWEDRPVLTVKNLKQYGGLLLLLLAGMGLSLGADALAYGGEWRTFRQFFEDRTTVYDFYPEVVMDDTYAPDLERIGVSDGAKLLLRNYNFGLDEAIDAQMLSDVAACAKERVGGARDWGEIFKDKLLLYRYRSFHGGDAPYNLLVWFGYALNIIAPVILMYGKDGKSYGKTGCVQLILLLLVRSVLWMFLLMRGRDPERITHPLYLAEFCLLVGMFLRRVVCRVAPAKAADSERDGALAARKLVYGAAAVLSLLSVAGMMKAVPAVWADQARRQEVNADWEAVDTYCRERQGTFLFEDVYSTVAFSGKLLECRDNTLANYDIAGGWMCKSPLYRKKLAVFGIEEAADALLYGNAYFIMSDEERKQRGVEWLTAFYADQGVKAEIVESDRIGENYGVYRIYASGENDGAGYVP